MSQVATPFVAARVSVYSPQARDHSVNALLQVAMKRMRNPHDGAHVLKFPWDRWSFVCSAAKREKSEIGYMRVSKADGD
jgi:hypothetical protein